VPGPGVTSSGADLVVAPGGVRIGRRPAADHRLHVWVSSRRMKAANICEARSPTGGHQVRRASNISGNDEGS